MMTVCDDLFEMAMENWFESWIMPDINLADEVLDIEAENMILKKAASVASTWIQTLWDHIDVIDRLRDIIEDEDNMLWMQRHPDPWRAMYTHRNPWYSMRDYPSSDVDDAEDEGTPVSKLLGGNVQKPGTQVRRARSLC